MSKIILGAEVHKRIETSEAVQKLLSDYGCFIKTRIGLHDASDDRQFCSENGIIILELIRDAGKEGDELQAGLAAIEGVTVKKMEF